MRSAFAARRHFTDGRGDGGFTLLEMLLVLVLLGLLAAAVGTGLLGSLETARTQEAARDLASHLRYAQGRAAIERTTHRVTFDVEERRYRLDDRPYVALPDGMEIELRTAAREVVADRYAAIRFLPEGGSTGGRVLLRHGGRVWTITVSWLTGGVELQQEIAGDADG